MTDDELRTYLRDHRNWHRWGASDQRGAVNLITAEKRVAASRLVRSGRTVSLSRAVPTQPAPNNRTPAMLYMERVGHAAGGGAAKDFQGMAYHGQSATHIDALCHVWDSDGLWGGRDPDREISLSGARWGSIEHWRDGIYTRGFLIDVPLHRGVGYVEQDDPVTWDELEAICRAQGIEPGPGDAVAIFCGRGAYENDHGPWSADATRRPGLDAGCVRFFRERDIAVVLWDMFDTAPNRDGLSFGVHSVIHAFGVAAIDSPLLEPLVKVSREEGRRDFLLTVNPLVVTGATGCLVNPVAVF
ncbi:cyclase family protein [Mycobacterium neglectum]|uniref:cyclase family protein n=1 Tax=Mycobacterium neglectum TaxID=242737 RepID=UPI000BFEAE8A|nr:cyclase family protein [Mycobacterium neglectum]